VLAVPISGSGSVREFPLDSKVWHNLSFQVPSINSHDPPSSSINPSACRLPPAAFRTGARAVFARTHSLTELPDCIRTVHRGDPWVSRDQVELLLEMVVKRRPFQVTRPGALALLTNREYDVVRLVAEGMKNDEISRHLKVTEHTVRNYLSHIFDKLGTSSRVELVLYTLRR